MFAYILISPLHLKVRFVCLKHTRLLKLKGVHFEGAVKRGKIFCSIISIVHLWHNQLSFGTSISIRINVLEETQNYLQTELLK